MGLKKVIASCGIHHSGSTWLFNVIRIAYDLDNTPTLGGFVSDFNWKQEFNGVKVIKAHWFLEPLAISAEQVFLTRRDLRDVCASAVRRGEIKLTAKDCLNYCKQEANNFETWVNWCTKKSKSIFIIDYRDIVKKEEELITKVIDKLALSVDPKVVLSKLKELSIPIKGRDEKTLLHHNHITDGRLGTYYKTLTEEIVKEIEEEGSYIKIKRLVVGPRFGDSAWDFFNYKAFIRAITRRLNTHILH